MAKSPTIDARLAQHPDLAPARRKWVLLLTAVGVIIFIVLGVLFSQNISYFEREFAEYAASGPPRHRAKARIGVPLTYFVLMMGVILSTSAGLLLSKRWVRRDTGTMLKRRLQGRYDISTQSAQEFQDLLRTKSADQIGRMVESLPVGSVFVEAWAAEPERTGYVVVWDDRLRHDPGWEVVVFSGDQMDDFDTVFPPKRFQW